MVTITNHEPRITNHELFSEAKKYIPGGVNSPVRSFKAVGGYPVFVNHAGGSKLYGECGGEFIDFCLSWGALILGHAHPKVTEALCQAIRGGTSFGTVTRLETELAKLIIEAVPSIDQVRLTNSGTEAVMGAIRLARAHTRKDKIIKFEGSYHGHVDYLLDSSGVPEDFTKHTIALPFNNIEKVEETVEKYHKNLAAIIVEPVGGNNGVVIPQSDFLHKLRDIADRYNIVLIFDEVITGFRLSYGGAQELFGVRADLTTLGKIIGGGLPVGAFGGRREIMQLLAPVGGVYQAGTLSGNPVAVTAGIATLNILKENSPYDTLEKKTKELCAAIESKAKSYEIELSINHIGSMFNVSFVPSGLFKNFFHGLLKEGVYLSPSGLEANFLSTVHTIEDIERTLKIIGKVLKNLRRT